MNVELFGQLNSNTAHSTLLAHAKGLYLKYYQFFSRDEYAALTPMLPDFSNSSLIIHLRSMHRDGTFV